MIGWLVDLALANQRVVRYRTPLGTVWASRATGVHWGRTDNGDRSPGRLSVVPSEEIPSTARRVR